MLPSFSNLHDDDHMMADHTSDDDGVVVGAVPLWEACKENVQVLREGRKVDDLNSALVADKSKLNEEINRFEDLIKSIDPNDDDPLALWTKYIQYLRQSCSSKKLNEVVERCTRIFCEDDRYRNDPRYINAWILRADSVRDSKDIFKFMNSNRIGEFVSEFYIAWASLMEESGKDSSADKIFERGIHCRAQPQELLERRHLEFRSRLGARWLKQQQDAQEDGIDFAPVNTAPPSSGRNAMGRLSSRGAANVSRPSAPFQQGLRNIQSSNQGVIRNERPGFAVFVDDHEEQEDSAPAWKALPNETEVAKENTRETEAWNGVTLSSASTFVPPASAVGASLDVFEDAEDEELTTRHTKATAAVPKFRKKKEETQEEVLARNPMANFKAPGPSKSSVDIHPNSFYLQPQWKTEDGNDQVCVEEVRAREWLAKKEVKFAVFEDDSSSDECEVSSKELENSAIKGFKEINDMFADCGTNSSVAVPPPPPSSSNISTEDRSMTTTRRLSFSSSSAVGSEAKASAPLQDDDMTINTKIALNDINELIGNVQIGNNNSCSVVKSENRGVNAMAKPPPTPLVGRQLEFSIFEDSVDEEDLSKAWSSEQKNSSLLDTKLPAAAPPVAAAPFTICEDEEEEPQRKPAFQVFGDEGENAFKRKPLGERHTCEEAESGSSKLKMKQVLEHAMAAHDTSGFVDEDDTEASGLSRVGVGLSAIMEGSLEDASLLGINNKFGISHKSKNHDKKILLLDPFEPSHRSSMIAKKSKHFYHNDGKMPSVAIGRQISLRHPLSSTTTTSFEISALLGKGRFGSVYSLRRINCADEYFALKISHEKNTIAWEYYIMDQFHTRVKYDGSPLVVKMYDLYTFSNNGQALVMEQGHHGTLHDLVNLYRQKGKSVPENLCMYYVLQVLKIISALHTADILHMDVKPDNFVLFNGPSCFSKSSMVASTIKVIDFGRSIDLRQYGKDTMFVGDCHADGFICSEMKAGKPWKYEADMYGIAAIAYFLLFGTYDMEFLVVDDDHEVSLKKPLRRYWQTKLWNQFFSTMLNSKKQPHHHFLEVQNAFETYLRSQSSDILNSIPKKLMEQEQYFTKS